MPSKQRGVRSRGTTPTGNLIAQLGIGALLPGGLTVVVNPFHPLAADDDDTETPFLSLEGAEAAKPGAPTSAADGAPYNVLVMPDDYGGPDLLIDIDRQTNIIGLGPFGIGEFNGIDRSPSTVRNVLVGGAGGLPDGLRPGLSIGCLPIIGDGMTTHQSYLSKARLSGNLDFSPSVGAGSRELLLSAEVFGDVIGAGQSGQSYVKYSRIRGDFNGGANWQFQVAERSRFQGLVTVDGYSRISTSRIDGGMTAAAAPAGIEPSGFQLSRLRGNWNGPAAFRGDGYSLRSFAPGGAALVGGLLQSLSDTPIVVFGAGDIGAGAGTLFLFPGYSTATAQASPVEWVAPRDGVIFGLNVRQVAGAGAGTITYAALRNGASALSVDVDNLTTGGAADPTQAQGVTAGDRISFSKATAGVLGASPTNIAASFLFA